VNREKSSIRMPVLFVGHGNPMNAITDNRFSRGWEDMVHDIPLPEAVLCVSAHWDTRGVRVNTSDRPETIHDFWGFPWELYDVVYPCQGSSEWAFETASIVTIIAVETDPDRGLDHGTWAVVKWMYPEADVPVFQVSLDTSMPASFHYELGQQLAPLRDKGILLIGSGNMVHNLAMMEMTDGAPPYDWAAEFDALLKNLIWEKEHDRLADYSGLGAEARLAVPTPEHYLPLLTVLGASNTEEPQNFYNEEIDLRSVSMTSLKIG
jgi:4,5-DOPA dioxygenase extradiol